jgi:glycosyltransferase involved in cell wall biosynthesis
VLSVLFRIPNILSIHGGDIYDPAKPKHLSPQRHGFFRFAIRLMLRIATRVVAQSSNTRGNAERIYHPGRAIDIIPLAYEPHVFTRKTREDLAFAECAKTVIGIGRLVPRKDFASFVRAIALMDDDVHGLIVGEGPERPLLESLIAELGLEDRVRLAGAVDEDTKHQLLAASDAFLLSSLHEGFGIIIQEAMQAGLPIVATNEGGQTDLIEEGVDGYLVPVGDSETMAGALRKALAGALPRGQGSLERFAPAAVAREYLRLAGVL